MASSFITGLDIGTGSVKAVVVEKSGGRPLVVKAVFKEPSAGLRKGAIVDLAEAASPVNRVLGEIKKVSRAAVKNIYLSIGTPQVKVQSSRGIVPVSRADNEIYQEDIDKAVKASQAVNLVAPNRTVIHNITKEFIVDGVGDIADPLGLAGNRLEVQSLIVDAFSPHIKNLVRVVELAGGEVAGLVFAPLVSSRAALSKKQKDLGTVLIDVGAGTTGLAVYEESKLIGVAKFPVGAGNVSNDIAIGLKVPVEVGEEVKLNYGYALARDVGHKETIELGKFFPEAKAAISRKFVAEITEQRLAEIFELVGNELKALGKQGELPGGAVLVGGGAKLPGLTELARAELKLSSQIGLTLGHEFSAPDGELGEALEDPEYVTAFGLALWGSDVLNKGRGGLLPGFGLKNLIRYFIP